MGLHQTCDHCGPAVLALVLVCLPSGNVLFYCRHCSNEYRRNIEIMGGALYDLDSAEIQAAPTE